MAEPTSSSATGCVVTVGGASEGEKKNEVAARIPFQVTIVKQYASSLRRRVYSVFTRRAYSRYNY